MAFLICLLLKPISSRGAVIGSGVGLSGLSTAEAAASMSPGGGGVSVSLEGGERLRVGQHDSGAGGKGDEESLRGPSLMRDGG